MRVEPDPATDPGTARNSRVVRGDVGDVTAHTVTGGGDIDIRVDEAGNEDGQPILFVHGFSMSRLVWSGQLGSELADEYRLVAMDVRGHGDSGKPRGEDAYADPERWAADFHAVIDALGLDDLVIVAWSGGAGWFSDYLLVHGEDRVAGMNLVAPRIAIRDEDLTETISGGMLDLIRRGVFATNDVEASMAGLERFVSLQTADPLPPADHVFLFGTVSLVPPYARAAMFARAVTPDDVLAELDAPVLLSHGDADDVMRPASTDHFAELIPNARTSFYPEVGHMPFLEAPDRFNRELRAFVEDL